jgi:hypothetical protein
MVDRPVAGQASSRMMRELTVPARYSTPSS